jgi:hypothetical protein
MDERVLLRSPMNAFEPCCLELLGLPRWCSLPSATTESLRVVRPIDDESLPFAWHLAHARRTPRVDWNKRH